MTEQQVEVVEVIINKELFRNEENFYSVYRVTLNDPSQKNLCITGYLPQLYDHQIVSVEGEYQQHPRYGLQFVVSKILPVSIRSKVAFIKYLSSNYFPGIGKVKAEKILEYYGIDFFHKVLNEAAFVMDDAFLTTIEKEMIIETIQTQNQLFEIINFFQDYGISMQLTLKINTVYKQKAIEIIRQNPYQLVYDIIGIGFKTVDKIALSLGFNKQHPLRLQALCVYQTMQLCLKSGSTFCLQETLLELITNQAIDLDVAVQSLNESLMNGYLVKEENRIYHKTQYDAEVISAQYFTLAPFKQMEALPKSVDILLEEYQQQQHISFDGSQIKAIHNFFEHDKNIITGGPGTGKTTIIQAIIALLRKCYPQYQIACCAPTGRASKRLKEMVNIEVVTIHSLLEFNLETGNFNRNQNNPLDVDILIIDEFSMVDNYVMGALSRAANKVRKILFIGDQDQLPAVSCGFVIRDCIQSEVFHVNTLTYNYRQQLGSNIIRLANQIKEQKINHQYMQGDVTFFQTGTNQKYLISKLYLSCLSAGYSVNEIQVLSCKYDGVNGIDAINATLQKAINPPSSTKRQLTFGYQVFREGDKILQLKNQPDDGVYNGDIGILIGIEYKDETDDRKNHLVVDFEGIIVTYTPDQFFNLKHAYCMSVHKAQGSQYPIVIFCVSNEQSMMLNRRLIYTAVTRASKHLYLLGQLPVLQKGILKDQSQFIETTLCQRIAIEQLSKM